MPAIYLVVYYRAGLYADFGINVYYLIASVYGWIAWSRGRKKSAVRQEEQEARDQERIDLIYGRGSKERKPRTCIYLFTPEDLDCDDLVDMVEDRPTALRDKALLARIKARSRENADALMRQISGLSEDDGMTDAGNAAAGPGIISF